MNEKNYAEESCEAPTHRHPQCGYWVLDKVQDRRVIVLAGNSTIPFLYRIHVCKLSTVAILVKGNKNYKVRPGQTFDISEGNIDIQLSEGGGNARAHGTYQVLCCGFGAPSQSFGESAEE
jgi:hypothetical protein